MAASPHPKDALVLHALRPDAPLPAEVRAHLETCSSCAAASARLLAASMELLSEEAPAPAPDRVLAAVRAEMTGPRRLERFVLKAAALLDIEESAARTLLSGVDNPEGWLATEGVSVRAVPTGPRLAQALATLCRIQPGAGLGMHGHAAPEETLVLEGGFGDSLGHEVWPGESLTMPAGSQHALTALPGLPCLCLVVAQLV